MTKMELLKVQSLFVWCTFFIYKCMYLSLSLSLPLSLSPMLLIVPFSKCQPVWRDNGNNPYKRERHRDKDRDGHYFMNPMWVRWTVPLSHKTCNVRSLKIKHNPIPRLICRYYLWVEYKGGYSHFWRGCVRGPNKF